MTISLIVFGIISYFVIGIFNARHVYAVDMSKLPNLSDPIAMKSEVEIRTAIVNSISHSSSCNMRYSLLSSRGCDCTKKLQWNKAKSSLELAKNGVNSLPSINRAAIFLWWASMISRFIRSGYRPVETTEEQKLIDWVGLDFVRDDPRYDHSTKQTWTAIEQKYESDHSMGHPLATALPRDAMKDPDRQAKAPRIPFRKGTK